MLFIYCLIILNLSKPSWKEEKVFGWFIIYFMGLHLQEIQILTVNGIFKLVTLSIKPDLCLLHTFPNSSLPFNPKWFQFRFSGHFEFRSRLTIFTRTPFPEVLSTFEHPIIRCTVLLILVFKYCIFSVIHSFCHSERLKVLIKWWMMKHVILLLSSLISSSIFVILS